MRALIDNYQSFLTDERQALLTDIGLLLLRLASGLFMAFAHGWGKLQKFLAGGEIQFADPIGVGAATSLFLAASAEFFAALAIAVGFLTRLSAIPLAFTMFVAGIIVHGDDPFRKKELALVYLVAYVVLLLTGPGRFSVDAILKKKFSST